MSKALVKKEDFGKIVTLKGDHKYDNKTIQRALKKYDLLPEEEVIVKNPITNKETAITIRRDGTQDSTLAIVMADQNSTREQKDGAVSSYLFERGKEAGSFLMDLFQFKGLHTKETRAFKSQMRFDFEMFTDSFVRYLRGIEGSIKKNLQWEMYDSLKKEYGIYLDEESHVEGCCVKDFWKNKGRDVSSTQSALLELALRSGAEADKLVEMREKITNDRMREKGFGTYIDHEGRVYSIFDKDLEEVINKDREDLEQYKTGNNNKNETKP
jgi:hypothetical protein